jgi:glycerol-3-phosphate dehydrogenase
MRDVIILGGGVTGCSIARELSAYKLDVLVLEKNSDVCEGTTKSNSGIVHAGYDAKPGSLKAKLNVKGNEMMGKLSEELDIPFKRNGSLVLCFEESGRSTLQRLYDQGIANGVKGLEILEGEAVRKLEPAVSDSVVAALHAPTGGIVCPFLLTIAMAENAAVNGAEFLLNTKVTDIRVIPGGYEVDTDKGPMQAKVVINAAGVHSDFFHNRVVGKEELHIIARRGEYCLMDKTVGDLVSHTLFQLPTALGKGVLVTPTVHGNLLTGPTATDIPDGEDTATTAEGIAELTAKAALSVRSLPSRSVITSFSGIRAHEEKDDFVIGSPDGFPGYFDAAGIESPGLTCAPAIGEYVAEQVADYLKAEKKSDFIATRKGIPNMALATPEERSALIEKDPRYANVICRCELVTEGEIVEAIHRPVGATTLDGVKRRTRAGMGRCQSGFCSPKVVEILARELNVDPAQIRKNNPGSEFLTGYIKEDI